MNEITEEEIVKVHNALIPICHKLAVSNLKIKKEVTLYTPFGNIILIFNIG